MAARQRYSSGISEQSKAPTFEDLRRSGDGTIAPNSLAASSDEELDSREFKTIFRHHAAAVAVVTLIGPAGPVGFTATSVTSVSAEPPVLAFSVSAASSSWPALATAETVVVNFLASNQADLAARFATPGIDRFSADDWFPLPTGEPALKNPRAQVRARILDRVPAGSSYILTLHALSHSYPQPEAGPLLYLDGTYHRLPETALSLDGSAAPAK